MRGTGLFQRAGHGRHRNAGAGAAQQPWAGHRAEWHRRLELGVVVLTDPFQRVGPTVVEDIFAVAVGLGIHRDHADDLPAFTAQDGVLWQPAGARIGRSAVFHGTEEFVADEGIAGTGAGVPV